MSRATILASVLLLVAGVAAVVTGTGSGESRAAADPRPNVLIIMTDDQRRDEMRHLPKTRRLIAREGVRYTRAYSENPLCCPARAALLTGQYSHNNGVVGNSARHGGGFARFPENQNINVALQKNGYATGWFGKYVNGYNTEAPSVHYVPPGWDEFHAPISGIRNYRRWQMNHNGELQKHRGHRTDVYADMSSRMVARLAARPKPFFAVVTYYAPHGGDPQVREDKLRYEPLPAPRHKGELRGKMPSWPASFNEKNLSDKPEYLRRLGKWTRVRALRKTRRARAESLLSVDDAVAANLRALRRAGELDETIVVFTSDNGFLLGEHGQIRKTFPYEESLGVPLLVRGPGFEPGSTVRAPVGLLDVAATAAHAGQVEGELGYPLDGEDLAGRPDLPYGPLLIEAGKLETLVPTPGEFSYRGVRDGRYTYVRYMTGEEELYDNRADPLQQRSRHADPEYAEVLARQRARTERLQDCAGADCRAR